MSASREEENRYARQARKDAHSFTEGMKQLGGRNKKLLAGIAALFIGQFGIHKYLLGYNQEGTILLVVTVLGYVFMGIGIGWTWFWIPATIGFIEGIIYLMKSDSEFYDIYQAGRRPWF